MGKFKVLSLLFVVSIVVSIILFKSYYSNKKIYKNDIITIDSLSKNKDVIFGKINLKNGKDEMVNVKFIFQLQEEYNNKKIKTYEKILEFVSTLAYLKCSVKASYIPIDIFVFLERGASVSAFVKNQLGVEDKKSIYLEKEEVLEYKNY